MDIEQIRAAKAKAEDQITKILSTFEEETGTVVQGIDLLLNLTVDKREHSVVGVQIKASV